MKVLITLLTVVLVGCFSTSVFAQIVGEVNQNGEFHYMVSADHWEREGRNATNEVKMYIEGAKKAIDSPGEYIPVMTREVPKEMVSPFGLKSVLVATSFVVYNQNNREVIMVSDPTVLSSSVAFSPFLVWCGLAFVALALLNMRDSLSAAPVFDVTASVVALLGFMLALSSVNTIIPILSALLFFAAIVPMSIVLGHQEGKEKRTMYWGASVIIYVMLVALLAFVYEA